MSDRGFYLMHFSLHGLIRARAPEIGRDADTGGQVRYVLDLLSALGRDQRVRKAELITRRIFDRRVGSDYARAGDELPGRARIIRLAAGPGRYIRKELLWPHIAAFADEVIDYIRRQKDVPDVLHGHYADGGLVAAMVAKTLGVPLIFTGHSLGRYKRASLLKRGRRRSVIDRIFNFPERVEAEEEVIENAALLIASSQHEADTHYRLYDHYMPERLFVLPPGCDISRFTRAASAAAATRLVARLAPFLRAPERPPLILLARPDAQKNIVAAVEFFAQGRLREVANLILFLGQRNSLDQLEPAERQVFSQLFSAIDRHDLHGHVAFPKIHNRAEATALFHHAAGKGGLLLALSRHENFGLTLVEGAAAGVPVVTSGAGGMAEVLARCNNGIRVDPDKPRLTAQAVMKLLHAPEQWRMFADNGQAAVREIYSWKSHLNHYLAHVERLSALTPALAMKAPVTRSNLRQMLFLSDLDDTLTGSHAAVARLNQELSSIPNLMFGVATGRSLEGARQVIERWAIARPILYITRVGTEIHYDFDGLRADEAWQRHINFRWSPDAIAAALTGEDWLVPQEDKAQSRFKVSYYCEDDEVRVEARIKQLLRRHLLQARVIVSRGRCVDIIPVRASKGLALRFVAARLGIDLKHVVAAGDAGNDLDMLRGQVRGIVVKNHSGELEELRDDPTVFFSSLRRADGVVDGLRHHGLSGNG